MIALTGLLWRNHVSRGRLFGIGAAGALLVLLSIAILAGRGGAAAALDLVDNAGFALLLPVTAAVFATSVLGDPAADGTLGYLLLTPRARWRIAVPALVAALFTVLPLTVVPLVTGVLLNGVSIRTVAAVAAAAALGGAAYCAVFAALGVRVQRALLVGLLYSAVWEGIVAGFGGGLARLSIRHYAASLLAALSGRPVPDDGVTGTTALVVLVGLVLAGGTLTTWLLRRYESRA